MNSIFISGHRGTTIKSIENTKEAFEYCIKNKIDYIEFDVRKTEDEQLIIFHDKKINRLLNGSGNIEKYTLKELQNFSYKNGQKIQNLEELFNQIQKKCRLMLEIKSHGIARKVIETIHQFGYKKDEILIQSFFPREIMDCYKLDDQYDYGLCLPFTFKIIPFQKKKVASWVYNKLIKPYPVNWVNIDGLFLYDEICGELNNNNINIILGAKNPEKYLSKLEKWNIKIVNSNDPVHFKNIFHSKNFS